MFFLSMAFSNSVTISSPGMSCNDLHEYECDSGYCVDNGVLCDYSDDCLDNSDEQPEKCFEYMFGCDLEGASTCSWDQDVDDDTDWVITRAAVDNEGIMPTTDHTLCTDQGKHTLVMFHISTVYPVLHSIQSFAIHLLLSSSLWFSDVLGIPVAACFFYLIYLLGPCRM